MWNAWEKQPKQTFDDTKRGTRLARSGPSSDRASSWSTTEYAAAGLKQFSGALCHVKLVTFTDGEPIISMMNRV